MKDVKFTNWANGEGFRIPRAALELAEISEGEKLEYHVAEDVVVMLKHRMTALEMIHVIHALKHLSDELLFELAECCGTCDKCLGEGEDDSFCPCDAECQHKPILPPELLEAAGIPAGAKVAAEIDPEKHTVTFSETGADASLSDIPVEIFEELEEHDVRLCVLERLLAEGGVVHE